MFANNSTAAHHAQRAGKIAVWPVIPHVPHLQLNQDPGNTVECTALAHLKAFVRIGTGIKNGLRLGSPHLMKTIHSFQRTRLGSPES